MPLRIAGGLHYLHPDRTDAPELGPVYAGELTDQDEVDAIVVDSGERFDARPAAPGSTGRRRPTRRAARPASWAGCCGCRSGSGPKFELNEIGASAGVNTMMERYFYDLGGIDGRAGRIRRCGSCPNGAAAPPAGAGRDRRDPRFGHRAGRPCRSRTGACASRPMSGPK